MISRILFSAVFACCTLFAFSQPNCVRTMVFFDFGKSDLRKDTRLRLDSLAKVIGKGSYIVELSGHTDSVNTEEFNLKLSEDRNKAVQGYLKKKAKGTLTFKPFNRGEMKPMVPNDSEENMAKNRRVDIFLLSPVDNKLVFTGDKNESIEIPADFPGECSVCEELKVAFIHNDQEAKSANIPLKSSAGRELTTSGMAQFGFGCPEKAATCLPVKITLPTPQVSRPECLSAWTLARGGSWEAGKSSLKYDRSINAIVAEDACYKMGTWAGFSKPVENICKHQMNFPTDLQIMKTKAYSKDSSYFIEASQMPLTRPCGTASSMFSWASDQGRYFYLKGEWKNYISNSQNTGNCDTTFTYTITRDNYQLVRPSDTTVYAKFKGFSSIKNAGYYIEELDLLLPLENVKKTTFSGNYLNYEHVLRFEEEKVYNVKYSDVKTKYKKGKKRLKVTVKKKSLPA